MNRALFLILLLSAPACLLAQTRPPEGALVAVPQPNTQWTISIEYPKEIPPASPDGTSPSPIPSAPPVRPVLLRCQEAREVRAVTVEYSDGAKRTGYVKDGRVFLPDPKTNGCAIAPLQDGDPEQPLYTEGYPGTNGLAPGEYQETEVVEKAECYRFFRNAGRNELGLPTPPRTIWVRTQDKVPCRVQIGAALWTYSPVTPLAAPVTIPPELLPYIARGENEQKAVDLLKKMNAR